MLYRCVLAILFILRLVKRSPQFAPKYVFLWASGSSGPAQCRRQTS